jgi:hypothetical protein
MKIEYNKDVLNVALYAVTITGMVNMVTVESQL